ncbi:hypothetical protein CAPN001_13590 [Capnocytophaga stomatis]|uniref:Uncharacterized protein n=1 Tax=Capnocytophaga stomatis TaxID=1848904 RepID=A0A250FYX4_9FLAO|nr:hypothetical protein [Capnocytophaga stomatis]ATA89196.1 hypothetical protein CGC58_05340 [Capnocytophaga stomatis]GIJ96790.1 hypothetical protein CAPN001_13590 [Capnocytophaga stomatis]GIM48583.1 hypothetical protein CAPN003_00350 [Capnocytophaga stomatis]
MNGITWDKFYFVITPDEFQLIFSTKDFYFMKTNCRVPLDYQYDSKESIFSAYQNFWEKIILGKIKLANPEFTDTYLPMYISMVDDYRKVRFEKFDSKSDGNIDFKRVRSKKAFIGLSPAELSFFNNKISMAYFNNEGKIGLSLVYPKSIDGVSTENEPTAPIYKGMVKSIKNICKKAKISDGKTEYKPNLWISENAKNLINSNIYLTKNNLKFI